MKQAETLSKTCKKISTLRNKNASAGITELKIPLDHNTPPKECNSSEEYWHTEQVPEEIEQLLIDCSIQHFGQANGTPFTTGTLKTALQYKGDSPTADLILEGKYNNLELNAATKLLIKHLKKRTDTILSGEITTEEIISKLKTWNE